MLVHGQDIPTTVPTEGENFRDIVGTGLARVHVDDPAILRDLVAVAGVLAEEMT